MRGPDQSFTASIPAYTKFFRFFLIFKMILIDFFKCFFLIVLKFFINFSKESTLIFGPEGPLANLAQRLGEAPMGRSDSDCGSAGR